MAGTDGWSAVTYDGDVGRSSHADGGGYYFQKGELLVAKEDLAAVLNILAGMGEPLAPSSAIEDVAPESHWVIVHLAENSTPVCSLVTTLKALERAGEHKPPYRVARTT